MGQYDEIDAGVQFESWLDSRMLNAQRAIGEQNTFSSRFLDPAYRIGHGGMGVYDAALKYDKTAALQGGVEAGFPPYSQVDVHARMVTEQDPNYWIDRRLLAQHPEPGSLKMSPESERTYIDYLKRIEENVEGLTARQKAITSIRSQDPSMHNLASLIEGAAAQLSVSEIQKLDMEAQIANLRKYGATEAQIKPLLDRLKAANSDQMQAGVRRLHNNINDGLTIWGRQMQNRGLTIGEFIPNSETKIPIGLVPSRYKGKGPNMSSLGKAGSFLLGLGGASGEIGMFSRLLKGGQWGEKDGQVDVFLPSEINDPNERLREMYQEGIFRNEDGSIML
jgi:hypothetical protein